MEGLLVLLGYMICGFCLVSLYKLALNKKWLENAEDGFENAIWIFAFWPVVLLLISIAAVAILFLLPVLWLFSESEL